MDTTPEASPARPTRRGRRSYLVLNPDLHDTIVENVRLGVPLREAAVASGVSEPAFHLWMSKGEKELLRVDGLRSAGEKAEVDPEREHYVRFVEDVTQARADAMARKVKRLDRIAEGGIVVDRTTTTRTLRDGTEETTVRERYAQPDPRPDIFQLERQWREHYGRRERIEHSGPEGGPIPLDVQVRAKEEFTSRVEQAAQRVNGNANGGNTPHPALPPAAPPQPGVPTLDLARPEQRGLS